MKFKLIKFKECSPQFCFIMFLLFLSWEGPLIIYFGASEGEVIIIMAGLVLTILIWFFFGIDSFCETFKLKKDTRLDI